jgi:GNAT superfamily N-acetyltransferase
MQPHPDLLPRAEVGAPASAIREGRDSDAAGFIALIDACWREYPGCLMDLDGEVPELRALATYVAGKQGRLWAAEDEARKVVGMVATYPLGADRAWEVGRMYVDRAHRGSGLAGRLLRGAEEHARAEGAQRIVLWTDTRFEPAHRFYEKNSYVRSGSIRVLDDVSKSLEFRYTKPIAGLSIELLDGAAATSAERRLAEILKASVDGGASLSFLPPMARDRAEKFWRKISGEVAANKVLLLAAWMDGVIAGTVQLDLAMSENQPHRAELEKLLVHPEFRGRGIGRALLARAEQAALGHNRRLLCVDANVGDAAETLFRVAGWREGGKIPGYVLGADRKPLDTITFYKALDA